MQKEELSYIKHSFGERILLIRIGVQLNFCNRYIAT